MQDYLPGVPCRTAPFYVRGVGDYEGTRKKFEHPLAVSGRGRHCAAVCGHHLWLVHFEGPPGGRLRLERRPAGAELHPDHVLFLPGRHGGGRAGQEGRHPGRPDSGGGAVLPGLFPHRPAGRRQRRHAVRQLRRTGGPGHRHRLQRDHFHRQRLVSRQEGHLLRRADDGLRGLRPGGGQFHQRADGKPGHRLARRLPGPWRGAGRNTGDHRHCPAPAPRGAGAAQAGAEGGRRRRRL